MKALFVEYPRCTTCKKALKYIKDHNVEVEDRNIVENVPTEAELKEWIERSGLEFKKFFNTSGQLYREMELKDKVKEMSLEEAVSLLATNGMLIKRPILVTEKSVCVGFKEDQYEEVLKNQ
ncbi:MAG: arsenate reductase family protein [Cellulosilyticum sp.]|nr:arsenate reductase family protein [Cellulosilyticum sp.]